MRKSNCLFENRHVTTPHITKTDYHPSLIKRPRHYCPRNPRNSRSRATATSLRKQYFHGNTRNVNHRPLANFGVTFSLRAFTQPPTEKKKETFLSRSRSRAWVRWGRGRRLICLNAMGNPWLGSRESSAAALGRKRDDLSENRTRAVLIVRNHTSTSRARALSVIYFGRSLARATVWDWSGECSFAEVRGCRVFFSSLLITCLMSG